MLQQTTRDWDKSIEVKQQVIDYFSRTHGTNISLKLTHRKWVPDRQYQTEKSSTRLPVGFSCPVYEKWSICHKREMFVKHMPPSPIYLNWLDLWSWPLTYWPDYQYNSSTHQGHLPTNFEVLLESVLKLSVAQGVGNYQPTCAKQYAHPFSKGA